MAPNYSKFYPITALAQSIPPSNPEDVSLLHPPNQLCSSTTLAHFGEQHIDDYLKKVKHHLKGPFKMFPVVNLTIHLTTVVDSTQVTHVFRYKFTTQETRVQQPTKQEALRFLNEVFLQTHTLQKSLGELLHTPKFDEDYVNNLKKLKEQLSELAGLLDRILMYYSNFDAIVNKPSVNAIKSCAKKLHKVIRKMTPWQLCNLIPDPDISVTAEDILCSVLGLQDNLSFRLANLSSQVRDHQSDKYFLLHFFEDCDEISDFGGSLTDIKAVASELQKLGFTEKRSVVVAEWIAKQPLADHQSLLAWVQHYIESLFTYDIFLNDHVSRYPYQETRVDQWFSVDVEREKKDDDGVENISVQVINTTPEKVSQLIEEIKKKQPESCFYYHGTDHASARSILEDGINLGAGHRRRDFSDGKGFYLTDTSNYAVKWAQKNKANAVLMFNVSEGYLANYRCLNLSPEERREDFQVVKNHFRNNKKLPRHLKQECGNCDYIKGSVSQGGAQHVPQNILQICIKNEDMADSIGNATNIRAVIFINFGTNCS